MIRAGKNLNIQTTMCLSPRWGADNKFFKTAANDREMGGGGGWEKT